MDLLLESGSEQGKKSLTCVMSHGRNSVGKALTGQSGTYPIADKNSLPEIGRMYNTDASGGIAQAWDAEAHSEFHITIAYDSPQAANSALNVYRHLQKQFGRDLRIHRTILNFEAIRRNKIPAQQRRADMVVVASHSAGELPSFFTQWLSQELSEAAERPLALVGIVEMGGMRQPSAVYCQLQELAKATGASFFHNQISLPKTPETPAATPSHPEDRWGLNEC